MLQGNWISSCYCLSHGNRLSASLFSVALGSFEQVGVKLSHVDARFGCTSRFGSFLLFFFLIGFLGVLGKLGIDSCRIVAE